MDGNYPDPLRCITMKAFTNQVLRAATAAKRQQRTKVRRLYLCRNNSRLVLGMLSRPANKFGLVKSTMQLLLAKIISYCSSPTTHCYSKNKNNSHNKSFIIHNYDNGLQGSGSCNEWWLSPRLCTLLGHT